VVVSTQHCIISAELGLYRRCTKTSMATETSSENSFVGQTTVYNIQTVSSCCNLDDNNKESSHTLT